MDGVPLRANCQSLRRACLVRVLADTIVPVMRLTSSYCDVAAVDRLVQFITGSSQLPASGFSALSPLITFSPSPGYGKLPTAHTWYVSGYGKLPTAHTWYVSG